MSNQIERQSAKLSNNEDHMQVLPRIGRNKILTIDGMILFGAIKDRHKDKQHNRIARMLLREARRLYPK